MQELLAVIAKGLVDNPDSVNVEADAPTEDGTIVYHIHVAESDMGRVIGKQGRIAKAIRTVVKAAATKEESKVNVDIISDEEAAQGLGTRKLIDSTEKAAEATVEAGETAAESFPQE